MDTLQAIIGDYPLFLKQILAEIKAEGFDLSDFVQMDHMCYRAPSLERYAVKKDALTNVGTLLGEAQINRRPIAVFRLDKPVYYEGWRIDTIELPAPKEGVATKEGLEHVEMVLFDDKETFLKKYSDKPFEMKAADRGVNPDIAFRLPTYTVKFHWLNLPTVIYLEQKLGMTDIRDSVHE
ncbi:MAG TPA: VOC family protein [Verrucomicrobiae bacterium]|nr:VOC family protein [Verrucomicrobiae bacterium]